MYWPTGKANARRWELRQQRYLNKARKLNALPRWYAPKYSPVS